MRRLAKILFAFALWTLPAAAPSVALAGPPAELKTDITASGGKVTLGDLFYNAGDGAGIVAARVAPGKMVVLDATRVQILARTNGVDWGNPLGLRRIVVQGEPAAREPAIETRTAAKTPASRAPLALAYLHSLNAGDIVRAEDLTWSREVIGGAEAPREPDSVIGMAARRPLREGEAVSMHDLAAPLAIRKDDMVAVNFRAEGLSLTLQAKAQNNAAAGQSVTLINTESKKVIEAVAVGPGQAVVGPAADQIRAARPSSSTLALR